MRKKKVLSHKEQEERLEIVLIKIMNTNVRFAKRIQHEAEFVRRAILINILKEMQEGPYDLQTVVRFSDNEQMQVSWRLPSIQFIKDLGIDESVIEAYKKKNLIHELIRQFIVNFEPSPDENISSEEAKELTELMKHVSSIKELALKSMKESLMRSGEANYYDDLKELFDDTGNFHRKTMGLVQEHELLKQQYKKRLWYSKNVNEILSKCKNPEMGNVRVYYWKATEKDTTGHIAIETFFERANGEAYGNKYMSFWPKMPLGEWESKINDLALFLKNLASDGVEGDWKQFYEDDKAAHKQREADKVLVLKNFNIGLMNLEFDTLLRLSVDAGQLKWTLPGRGYQEYHHNCCTFALSMLFKGKIAYLSGDEQAKYRDTSWVELINYMSHPGGSDMASELYKLKDEITRDYPYSSWLPWVFIREAYKRAEKRGIITTPKNTKSLVKRLVKEQNKIERIAAGVVSIAPHRNIIWNDNNLNDNNTEYKKETLAFKKA